jgi:anti-sigma regulatory factor (Ser/Thr protein kinase)
MRIADRARDPRTEEQTHIAGVDDRLDRPPARRRSSEWHTARAKTRDAVSACRELDFTHDCLGTLRRFVAQSAADASLDPARIEDLVLAINELATNSVRHGGGTGTLRMWREGNVLLCDVRDQGRIPQPSTCLIAPEPTQITGRGLWIVSQLCDLVQIRSSRSGGGVRVHMRLT